MSVKITTVEFNVVIYVDGEMQSRSAGFVSRADAEYTVQRYRERAQEWKIPQDAQYVIETVTKVTTTEVETEVV